MQAMACYHDCMDEYLTVAQAAEAMGISARALRNRIDRGDVMAAKVNPRLLMIARSEVERWRGKGRLKAWEGRRLRERRTETDSSDAFEAMRPVPSPTP